MGFGSLIGRGGRGALGRKIGRGGGDGVSVRMPDIDALFERMAGLSFPAQTKVLRRSLTRGATIIRREIRSRAPISKDKDPGQLKRSIGRLSTKVRLDRRIAYVVVGPRHKIAPHRHLVIRGTKLRAKRTAGIRLGLGQITGKITGDDSWLRDGLDAARNAASERMMSSWSQFIEEAWGRG